MTAIHGILYTLCIWGMLDVVDDPPKFLSHSTKADSVFIVNCARVVVVVRSVEDINEMKGTCKPCSYFGMIIQMTTYSLKRTSSYFRFPWQQLNFHWCVCSCFCMNLRKEIKTKLLIRCLGAMWAHCVRMLCFRYSLVM